LHKFILNTSKSPVFAGLHLIEIETKSKLMCSTSTVAIERV